MKTMNEIPLKDVAAGILSQGFQADVIPDKVNGGHVHGIGFIGLSDNSMAEFLLLGINKGVFEMGVSMPDVARLINSGKELNMVFFPALSYALSKYLTSEKFEGCEFYRHEKGKKEGQDVPVIYCKLSAIDYNKGNKTISAIPTFYSNEHLVLFKYLSVQNDKWSEVING
jgi:hypothetical protein